MDNKKTLKNPGPRPTDPSLIKFSDDCFEDSGRQMTTYTTVNPSGYGYPKRWPTLESALEYVKKTNHELYIKTRPVLVRVKWF